MQRKVKNTVLYSVVAMVLTAVSCPSALAGYWKITYELDGASTGTVSDGSTGSLEWSETQDSPTWGLAHTSSGAVQENGHASVTSLGDVVVVFTWKKSSPTDASEPPATIIYKTDSHASVYAPSVAFDSAQIVLNNDTSASVNTLTHNFQGFPFTQKQKIGSRLHQVDTSAGALNASGDWTVRAPAVSLESTITLVTSDNTPDPFVENIVEYQVGLDNRKVTLFRPGAIGETFDPDGTARGHSTFSHYTHWSPDPLDRYRSFNYQTFIPVFAGSWANGSSNPDVTWNWFPPEGWAEKPNDPLSNDDDITRDQGVWSMDMATLRKDEYWAIHGGHDRWAGTPDASKTVTLTYRATDNGDNATATAKYILTLHNPVEKTGESSSPVTASGPLWGSDPNGGTTLLVVHGPVQANAVSVSQGHAASEGWTAVVGAEAGLEISKLKVPLGISAEYNSSHSAEFTSSRALDFAVPQGSYVYPRFLHTYNRHVTSFRHFTEAGEHKIGFGPAFPDHNAVWDEYAGSSITWSPITLGTTPVPVFDPEDPKPATDPVE